MFHRTARVTGHVTLAERTYRVRLECPDVAAAIRPGQFVMLRLPNTTDPLLGRPFALYDTVLDSAGKPIGIDVVYLLVGCGPEPMLHALAKTARAWGVPCQVSLETPMACGVGICFSCVTKVRTPDGWDYRRVCVDGPVFDAAGLAWDGE